MRLYQEYKHNMSLSHKFANVIVKKKIHIDDVVALLSQYKLLSLLPEIKRRLQQIGTIEERKNTIVIETPFDVNDASQSKIKKIVGDDSAPHTVTINKALLAGFRAHYKGKLYDGSVERVIQQLLETNNTMRV